MTVAVLKTKAEVALAEQFEAIVGQLPGGAALTAFRRKAFAVFAELGLPHRRSEAWKYTDLRAAIKEALPLAVADATPVTAKEIDHALGPLAGLTGQRLVLVNGHYRAELSRPGGAKSVTVTPLGATLGAVSDDQAVRQLQSAGPKDDSIIALNTALAADGLRIDVAAGAQPKKPVLVVHVTAGATARHAVTRVVLLVRPAAQATVIEAFVALAGAARGQVNAATEVMIGEGATCHHLKVAIGAGTHLSTWAPTLTAKSTYRAFQLTAGSELVRNQVFALYEGPGARLDVSGVFLGRGAEHIDTTLVVDHAVPACQSRELFKGVLDGQARGVFQGKVIVRPDAQKSDGRQMAQVLMLSPDAEFDSKPELEIYADDVVCGHGSTAAEIDADLLFYCRSRGIPLAAARALLIESFVGEAIDKVEDEKVRAALAAIAADWLRDNM